MNVIDSLLRQLNEKKVMLSIKGDDLVIQGRRETLAPELVALLRENKRALIDLINAGRYVGPIETIVNAPPNLIPAGCSAITPEMLPMVKLTQAQIDGIVDGVPGGAANVQDIYPLAPLQEGILFHHLMSAQGDVYLVPSLLSFDKRERMERYLDALRSVIARHDILRTAVVWEGLPEPAQVVWREAELEVEEVTLGPFDGQVGDGEAARQLRARFDPRRVRLDVSRAPLMRCFASYDEVDERWLLLQLTHHLAIDHIALMIMMREAQAYLSGEADRLPAPAPFRNLVAQARFGIDQSEHEAFFRGMLGAVAEPTAPYGLLEVPDEGSGTEQARIGLERGLVRRLRERARGLGVSAASICHLAWGLALARVSGREDVVFGTVLSGRMQGGGGADRALGLFINTLPVRIRIGEEGVEQGVRQAHLLLAEVIRHEHAPLALAQRCSGVAAPMRLFGALLNCRNSPRETRRSPEVAMSWGGGKILSAEGRTIYPLTLSVDDLGDVITLTAHSVAPIDPGQVCELMKTALERLVEALESAPETAVRAIDVMPDAERRQLLVEWNATEADYPAAGSWREKRVHELFEQQARQRPDGIALVCEDQQVSYGELEKRSNQLGHHLRAMGVRPEVVVGLFVERSVEMVVGMLGILKAGGAYLPLDPSYPTERLSYMLEDAETPVVVTQGELKELLSFYEGEKVCVDQEWEAIAGKPECEVGSGVMAENLAYVIYTSGSTGRPKGVAIEHASAVAFLEWVGRSFSVEELSGVVASTSVCFDLSVYELFGPLACGGKALMAKNALDFPTLAAANQATLINTVPSAITELVRNNDLPSSVRIVNLAGEPLSEQTVTSIYRKSQVKEVNNLYGPTEYTTYATWARALPNETPTIGRPIANTQVYVLDQETQPAPIRVAGELFIGGAGLARGYQKRPDQTAERFVPDPFGEAGSRLYRTGDLTRYRPDGNIEYLGRADHQVKIRGYRIEPGEVEAALRENPEIQETAVVAQEDVAGDKRLIGYVVWREGKVGNTGELRNYLKQRLPDYMLPSALVALERLPLTSNGKVDRKALPAPEGRPEAIAYVAARTPMEELLTGIWAEALRRERIGVHDNFFELGGNSLLVMRIVAKMRQVLKIEVPLRMLFEEPTIAQLGERIEEMQRTDTGLTLPPLMARPRVGPIALSFAQERLWFLEQLGLAGSAYNMPAAFRLQGILDAEALERSLAELARRHESLRTHFEAVNGEGVQVVDPPGAFRLEVVDLSQLPEQEREAEALRRRQAEIEQPFDLTRGPLFRVSLLRLGSEDHLLLMTMHHIISDGWSIGIMIRELGALYAGFIEGRPARLPELEAQYADYAVWQREWLSGEVLEKQLSYWKENLEGAPVLELPTDRPRPATPSYKGAAISFELSAELTAGLKKLGREEGATLYMALLAALEALLGRWSGQQDFVVGSPIAGRRYRETEGLIGFFVNMLALRVDLGGRPSFRELLGRVKEVTLGAYGRQDMPFERLVAELQPQRDLSRQPLFQIVFTLQNLPQEELELPGLKLRPIGSGRVSSKFDVTIALQETSAGLRGVLEYATDLFDPATVERLMDHWKRLLEGAVVNPESAVWELPILGEQERRQLLEEWMGVEIEYPAESCVHELFAQQAMRRPDGIALVCGDEQVSYGELEKRSNQLGHHLRAMGVGPEIVVGLCVERSVEMVVAMLGILKAGGAYLPLDPSYPAERLSYMLEDTETPVVVTQGALKERLSSYEGEKVSVDQEWEAIAGEPECEVASVGMAENLAYVMYTSGSTGRPKGVGVDNRNIVRLVKGPQDVFVRSGDMVLQMAPLAFDASTFEIWGALLNGAGLTLYPSSIVDIGKLRELIERDRISVIWLTAGLFHQVVEESLSTLSGVMMLLAGGDVLSVGHVQQIVKQNSGCRMINGYGPTECTTFSSWYEVKELGVDARTVPIGRPLANGSCYVLDEIGNPAPVGVEGELYIGGEGVARGYLGRPEQTAERFVPQPFQGGGERLYRTGDLVRWGKDGNLEFVRRVDDQVKIRGHRIEPGELETVLREAPCVRDAAAMVREDVAGEKRLIGYVVWREGEAGDAGELRNYLKRRLPDYMLPSALVALDRLPLTANGKVDRKMLPAPELGRSEVDANYAGARTPIEEILLEIFQEVLKVKRVGIEDNFFALGGHSLMATVLVSRIRASLGVELTLRTIFEAATVAEIALRVEESLRSEKGTKSRPVLRPLARPEQVPLSYAQQRLWFIDQLEGGSKEYNVPVCLRLRGRLDVETLDRVLQTIVGRHESLRTHFGEVEAKPVQVIDAMLRLDVRVEDWSGQGKASQEQAIEAARRLESEQPFDLLRGPMLRAKLLKLGEQEHILLLTFHHIVFDEWSLGVFNRELMVLYEAFREGGDNPLQPLQAQYADFATWQREWLSEGVMEEQLAYWKRQLAGIPDQLQLPQDRPRPATPNFIAGSCVSSMSSEGLLGLKRPGQTEYASLYMILLTAYAAVLWRYSGQEDIVIGSPIANRQNAQMEPLIGFFVNVLAMRTRVDPKRSFRELLAGVRATTLEAYQNQDVPFERLVEELSPQRRRNMAPIYQVVFSMHNGPIGKPQLKGLEIEWVSAHSPRVRVDLELHVTESGGQIHLAWVYSRDLFERWRIEQMGHHFVRLLGAAASDPDAPLYRLEMMSVSERRQLLEEWNGGAVETRQMGLPALFEKQVERCREAVAVVCGDEILSYGELNESANRLANYLVRMGVGPECVVGIALERSVMMVVAVMAALKSGGAYLPLDPSYPAERLTFMLEDSGVPVVLTESRILNLLPSGYAQAVRLDEEWKQIEEQPNQNLWHEIDSAQAAYVIYTSGSSGTPKGVAVTHSGIASLSESQVERLGVTRQSRILQFASLNFDASVWEVVMALTNGASLVLVGEESRSGGQLQKVMKEQAVTHATLPPSILATLEPGEGLALETLVVAGEACAGELVDRWSKELRMINAYGPTETTVCATMSGLLAGCEEPPIGTAILGARVYVLDEWMEPAPIGAPGELYLSGAGLARGYLGQPALTAEKFAPNPHNRVEGERLYRTGDLVRWRRDGNLEFIGRVDNQVKVRGIRVELGEIEAALMKQSGIRQAVVVMREDQPGEKRLVGYVVAAEGQAVDVDGLRRSLGKSLPAHQAPSALVALERLPLTPNGKVDRKALPAPEKRSESAEYVAPRTAIEEELAGIWAGALGLERVGIRDNFFELGGDSILSIQVVGRVKEAGLNFTVAQLFEHQTIEALAAIVTVAQRGQGREVVLPGPAPFELIDEEDRLRLPKGIEDAYPMSKLQVGMLFHTEYSPEAPVYYNIVGYHLRARLDVAVLQRAVEQMVRRHPVLRTSFHFSGYSEPLQLVHERGEISIQVEDLTHLSMEEQEEALGEWMEAEKKRGFDPGQPGLLRLHVHRRSEESFQFTKTEHHSILDGWSEAVLLTELLTCYTSLLQDGEWRSEPLQSHYRDFIALEQEALQSAQARQFWEEQLSGINVGQMPWGKPQSTAVRTGSLRVPVDDELSEKLKGLARLAEVPIKNVLLAIHLRLMKLLSGQEDVVTGVVSNGRIEGSDGERVLGLFLNTMPMRMRLRGGRWIDLVRQSAALERSLMPHRRYPLPELQLLAGKITLFEVAFNFTHFHVYRSLREIPGLEFQGYRGFGQSNFSIAVEFNLDTHSSKVGLFLNYNQEVIDRDQIEAIGSYYLAAMRRAVDAPEERYETACLLSESERRQLLDEWNGSEQEYPRERRIHELFAERASLAPDAIALVYEDEQVSYGELEKRSNRLGNHLQAMGVGPEVVVGLCVERSVEMVVGLLGILKAGGAYLPLDPSYPAERLQYMLEDAWAPVVVAQESLLEALPYYQGAIVLLDRDWESIATQQGSEVSGGVTAENLAYVIYTSGSTGRPKGVGVVHRNVMRLIKGTADIYVTSDDVMLHMAPLAFDASTYEVWGALLNGATLALYPGRVIDTRKLKELIEKEEISVLWLTAGLFHQVVEENLSSLARVRMLLAGGDVLSVGHVRQVVELGGDCRMINGYGPTECTTFSSWYEVRRLEADARTVPIGRPLANGSCYVLDESCNPVPVGVVGELYIGGEGLARGYLGRPELTAERYVPRPFTQDGGERLYRTGDIVRWGRDGNLEFVGRLDDQVKIRGYRIEPGEVEVALREDQRIQAAAAVVREDVVGHKRLVGYVVCREGVVADAGELRSYLSQRLPEYLVPSALVVLERLPLTPNGKLDRRALPSPQTVRDEGTGIYVAPRSPSEVSLSKIWSEVLRLDQVGIHDNFFELGGDSILGIQVIAKARERGLELDIKSLFEHPTISELVGQGRVGRQKPIRSVEAFELISRQDRERIPESVEDAYPLSWLQAGMVFHSLWEQASATYHDVISQRVEEKLDEAALREVLEGVVRRHPALRTTLHLGQYEEPLQCVHREMRAWVETADWEKMDKPDQERGLKSFMEEESRREFDLAGGPLAKFFVHRLGAEEFQFTLSVHHAIVDGWSVATLMTEIFENYLGRLEGRLETSARPLLSDYREFIAEERRALRSREHREYWERVIGEMERAPLWRVEGQSEASEEVRGEEDASETIQIILPEEIGKGVSAFAQRAGTPVKSVFFAAHLNTLRAFMGGREVMTGLVSNARLEEEDGERVIGMFLNTTPVRFKADEKGSWEDLARRALELEQEMLAHRRYPVVEVYRRHGGKDLLDVIFNFINFHVARALTGRLKGRITQGIYQINFPLGITLNFNSQSGSGGLGISYQNRKLTRLYAEKFAEMYLMSLREMIERPRSLYMERPLLPMRDQLQLIDWNRTEAEYPAGRCIHELFAEQAARAPEAIALVCEDWQLSYGELEKRSNQMGHYLRAMGVGPEMVVGLCLERSVEMVVTMLGIVKAGGAYLPLDPAYPTERLRYMLEDAQAPVVVTGQSELALLSCYEGAKVCVDRDRGVIAMQPESEVSGGVTAENLAYVIYTSGSTGEPKGVAIQHRSLCSLARAQELRFGLKSSDHVLLFSSLNFDASVWEMVMAFSTGAGLYLATEEIRLSSSKLIETLRNQAITVATIPPSLLAVTSGDEIPEFHTVITGGEACPAEAVAHWGSGRRFFNVYGPTETTCAVTAMECSRDKQGPPIGRPMANSQIYILDECLQPAPIGVAGEIHIGGEGLARGYFEYPEMTAERFIPNPYDEEAGNRIYKTGDVGRYLADGNIEFLGRLDTQVKIRGYRIELGEIEARLLEYPGVREAVVLARNSGAGDKQLVAYYTISPEQDQEAMKTEDLRTHLLSRLPEYMTPAAYVRLDALPLAPNGKLDRKALPEAEAYASRGYEAPVGEVEQILARLWAELFKLDRVGRHDNFFELGGNSVVSIQLADRARKAGVTITPRDLFQYQTVGELAAKVSESGNAEFSSSKTTEAVRDLSAEAVLDPAIAATAERRTTSEVANALLTGASGFLGAFLLSELLKRTQAKIYCLIRSSDIAEGRMRISNQLKAFELWDESLSARIVPVPGDLSKPRLGLSQEQFDELAEVIDIIYHNGAMVNTVYPYDVLKPANVLGTQEILRVASRRQVKPVHFVSTLSVFAPPNGQPLASATTEAQLLENWQSLSSGYSQSKWVAEKMVRIAGSRGIPIAIYRPSFISGATRTGAVNPNDSLTHFIRACIKSGCVPDIDTEINMVPVDYVSRAVIALSMRNYVLGRAWNVINMRSVSMQEISSCFLSSGVPMRKVTYEEWQSRCNSNGAKAALLNFYTPHSNKNKTIIFPEDLKISIMNTSRVLEAEGVRCPIITPQLLRSYISYLRVHEG